MELEAKIADLGFSAKPYYLYIFFFQKFCLEIFFSKFKILCVWIEKRDRKLGFFYFGIFEKINPNIKKILSRFFGGFF